MPVMRGDGSEHQAMPRSVLKKKNWHHQLRIVMMRGGSGIGIRRCPRRAECGEGCQKAETIGELLKTGIPHVLSPNMMNRDCDGSSCD